jgi:hypothetical protein
MRQRRGIHRVPGRSRPCNDKDAVIETDCSQGRLALARGRTRRLIAGIKALSKVSINWVLFQDKSIGFEQEAPFHSLFAGSPGWNVHIHMI